ncbi:MAG: hypothetical protein WBB62_16040 [Rhodococcus sp. (in: high G+C Gram-positive bacteria)]
MSVRSNVLWMIEDLEPFPDAPAIGDTYSPTTFWAAPADVGLSSELSCEVSVEVEEVVTDLGVERVAHLAHGFTTLLPAHIRGNGRVTLNGCLVWDRYLWMDYRTRPSGRATVISRHPVTQRATQEPTSHPGWYSVTYEGPKVLQPQGYIPPDHQVVSYALSVELVPPV